MKHGQIDITSELLRSVGELTPQNAHEPRRAGEITWVIYVITRW
jgi:hypothetical protein